MGIFSKIQRAYDVLAEDDSIAKGNEFETYVVDHFNPKYFDVVSWSTDNTRKHDRIQYFTNWTRKSSNFITISTI
jgi:hypothetical protein